MPWPVYARHLAAVGAVLALSGASCTQQFDLGTAPVVVIESTADTDGGIKSTLSQFMSTALQPADWQYAFFSNSPENAVTLDSLGPRHILVQLIDGGAIPLLANGSVRSMADWDFAELNAILRPVLQVADKSPMIQIAVPPNVAGMTDSTQQIIPAAFAEYCADLVAYYNEDGFDWGSDHIARPDDWPQQKIAYWGILSDINAASFSAAPPQLAAQYAAIYAQTTAAMQNATTTPLAFSALEFDDFAGTGGNLTSPTTPDGQSVLQGFLSATALTQSSINDVAIHFFGAATGPSTPDSTLFANARPFAVDVAKVRSALDLDAPNLPIWVTENNVQADVPDDHGMSMSSHSQADFENDPRGTSAFFAAWRPYVFSLLGKAGSNALYHWDFTAGHCTPPLDSHCAMSQADAALLNIDLDSQNAEVDFSTGTPFISYWVDQWLGRMFPADPGGTILQIGAYDTTSLEILAVRNDQARSVVVMVVDIAPETAAVANGHGVPKTVVVDVSRLGTFASASMLTIDASTDANLGPGDPKPLAPAPRMVVTLHGYGVAFLTLQMK